MYLARRWLPLSLVCGSIVLAASTASAQDDTPQAAPIVEFAQPPGPLVLPDAPREVEPTTLEEYQSRMAGLKAALRAARLNQDDAAVADLTRKTAWLQLWAKEHVHKQDPGLFTGGLVALGVGGATFIGGAVVVSAGLLSNCQPGFFFFPSCSGNSTVITVGAGMMIGGGVLALISIPIILAGNKKVLDTAPRASVVVGPSRVGLSVTF